MIGYFRAPFVLSVISRYFGYFRLIGHELKVLTFCSLSSFFVGSKAWYGLWHTSETVENYWIFNKDISEIPDPFWMYAKRRVYLKYRIIPIISGFLGFSKDFQNRSGLLSEKMLGSGSGSVRYPVGTAGLSMILYCTFPPKNQREQTGRILNRGIIREAPLA